MMRILATLAALMLLLTSSTPAAAIQCKHSGKSWRLIDGRKCWTDRWMPKAGLTWATSPKPAAKVARPARFRAAAVPQPPPPSLPPVAILGDLEGSLAAKAEAMRARLDAPPPVRMVRTVLVGPYPAGEVVERVPMPPPRPTTAGQSRPAALLWVPVLLMLLMVGTAAAEEARE